ncbi:lycopene cyclase domain-containing protein [Draconibacterium sp. IB214405]|uniref:lycopene cyclase domain-containing protein n=1 Tax=Draconibacterium sp. IB214405 TaxID=3097352 RepID=UPI002A106D56|nr:lycopene cyclase domain-containing protein [Draconibacterium sp. IB214405]MDX8337638.1 lycopene cyclase domain-containing protein [Draconibacterium sp. IB214405]
MEIQNLSYLLLLLIYLVIPVVLSFQKKVRFVFRLKYILPAVIFAGAIFVMWDIRFLQMGIWSFNPDYLSGIELLRLPVEEWLSFLIIPLSSIYIYEWLKVRFEDFEKPNIFLIVSLVLLVTTGVLAYVFRARMFSFFTFFLSAIYLGYTVFRNRFKKYYTKFYLALLISLIPFLVVSAILNSLPAIIYDSTHVIGITLTGVPVEKIGYLFLLLLINITIYEYLNNRRHY